MKRLQQLYGIEIEEVNTAYSSQECSSCGYVDKENRKGAQEFECKCCGNKTNAQVNGARIFSREVFLGVYICRKSESLRG